jgi:hypothetical protein
MDRFQAGENLDAAASEPTLPEAMEAARRQRPFTVASICREDLQGLLSETEIDSLSDADMVTIADKMSDAYRESGGYWESLELMARSVLQRQAIDEPAASPHGRGSQANTG